MHAATPLLSATWFDGRSPQAQDVELQWTGSELLLHHRASGATRRYVGREVQWPERTRHGQRQVLLPDGSVLSLPDAAAWDEWSTQLGLSPSLAVRWALSWRASLAALGLLLVVMASAWTWGIPWGAQRVADWMPASWEARLGESVMTEMRDQGWLKDSQVPEAQRQRIDAAVHRLLASVPADWNLPPVRVQVLRAPDWLGPNAFALPGGQIVVTDALVALLDSGQGPVDEALLGVIAHEIGHVRGRHGLRMLTESAAAGALMAWWIGDYSTLLAGAPTALMHAQYSRDHEREADALGLELMHAAGLDPRAMVRFFAALKKAAPKRDGDDPWFGLSTHPADSERVRFFEEGARQRAP